MPSGLLLLNKPSGPTSHDIVDAVRRRTGIRRVGHTGTLDPLAEGLLVLLIGQATRMSEYLVGADKRYTAVIRFGAATDTYDAAGAVTAHAPVHFDRAGLARALQAFHGPQLQTPPPHSAIKIGGRKAYQLARAGHPPDLAPRPITLHALHLRDWAPPDATVEIYCSSGTYIRSLAHDLGRALGSAAHLAALTRTHSGRFSLANALELDDLRLATASGAWPDHLIPLADILPDPPTLPLTSPQATITLHGNPLPAPSARRMNGAIAAGRREPCLPRGPRSRNGGWLARRDIAKERPAARARRSCPRFVRSPMAGPPRRRDLAAR